MTPLLLLRLCLWMCGVTTREEVLPWKSFDVNWRVHSSSKLAQVVIAPTNCMWKIYDPCLVHLTLALTSYVLHLLTIWHWSMRLVYWIRFSMPRSHLICHGTYGSRCMRLKQLAIATAGQFLTICICYIITNQAESFDSARCRWPGGWIIVLANIITGSPCYYIAIVFAMALCGLLCVKRLRFHMSESWDKVFQHQILSVDLLPLTK